MSRWTSCLRPLADSSECEVRTVGRGEEFEIPDPPEPIVNGFIDLGQLAAEFLVLGLDPYPRKPGAEFIPPELVVDPEEHPFAALKALKEADQAPKARKPGKK